MTQTRAEQVAAVLRAGILGGDYYSGQRMVELQLAGAHHVSQNTIREALYILEREGWVVKHDRRGVYVRAFTRAEAAEIVGLAAAIEGEIAAAWSRSQMTAIAHMLAPIVMAAQTGDPAGAGLRLIEAHAALVPIGTITAAVLGGLHNWLRVIEAAYAAQQPRPLAVVDRLMRLHEAALADLRTGNPAGIAAAMRGFAEAGGA